MFKNKNTEKTQKVQKHKNTEKTRVRATSPGSERYQHEGTVTKKATKKETSIKTQ